jgi:hypothetical protein
MSSEGQPTIPLSDGGERWEYRVMLMNVQGFLGPSVDLEQLRQYLDAAGDEGWELVAAVPITRGQGSMSDLMGILKRRRR